MKEEGGQVQLRGRMLDRKVAVRQTQEGSLRDTEGLAAGTSADYEIDCDGYSEVTLYGKLESGGAAADLEVTVLLNRLRANGTYQQMLQEVTPYIDNPASVLAGDVYKLVRLRTGGATKITARVKNNNAASKIVHLSYSLVT